MIRCQMSVTHSHFYIVMSEDFLQSKDISTRHHEMRSKRMAQNVCQLTAREDDRRFFHHG